MIKISYIKRNMDLQFNQFKIRSKKSFRLQRNIRILHSTPSITRERNRIIIILPKKTSLTYLYKYILGIMHQQEKMCRRIIEMYLKIDYWKRISERQKSHKP